MFRDFPIFSRICIFFLLTLSLLLFSLLIFLFSLPLPCSAFHLSILSEVWLLNFLRQDLHKVLRSTSSHYKTCATYFPVLLLTTRLAQSTSQYYFVHLCTTYYKTCTKYFPVLLCITRLAPSTYQYLFVLITRLAQKVLPSTALHYKTCTKYFPSLLGTTRLAQSTPQYCFALQALRKIFPSTKLYRRALTERSFTQRRFYTEKLLHREAFAHRTFYTQILLHSEAFTQKPLQREAFTHWSFYTHILLHSEAFAQKLLNSEAFTQVILYTEKLLHTALRKSVHVHNGYRNCSSTTGSKRQSEKNVDFEALLNGMLKGKWSTPK